MSDMCEQKSIRYPFANLFAALVIALVLNCFLATVTSAQEDGQEASPPETLTIGVLALEGATRALEAWQSTTDLLNRSAARSNLPYEFALQPHTHSSLIEAVENGAIDLMLTDPSMFAGFEMENGARAVLSLARMWEGAAIDLSGALVFVRQSETARSLSDLEGKRVMAVAPNDFAGWWLAEQEFRKSGLEPKDFFSNLLFSGGNEREAVYAVQSGLVDAGIVRAGLLEQLAEAGIIELSDYAPLNLRRYEAYPFWTSTPLYPEWVLSALESVPEPALAHVIDTLLELSPDSPESEASGGYVWQAPQNYKSVHDLLISLRVRPYENYFQQAAMRIYRAYRGPILAIAVLSLLSVAFLVYEVRRNRQLAEEQRNVLQSEARSKNFYRNAVEEHTVFCMLSATGVISHVNERFTHILGRSRKALVETQVAELLTEKDRALLQTEIVKAMEVGAPWQGALQLKKEDGGFAWVQCTFIPVTRTTNELSEIALVASDVTQTRKGVSEERFQNTLELLQDQVVVIRPGTLEILYCNAAAEQRLIKERTGGDWKGKSASAFVTAKDFKHLEMRCDAISKGPQRRVIWEAAGKGDVTYEISLEYCEPAQDEPRIVAMYRDVTERKVAERAKNEFIATVSHELRTPLTSIKGALGLALSGAVGEMPEKVGDLVTLANTNCERLRIMINDILDLEKLESSELDFKMEPFDLVELVHESVDANQHYANQFKATFKENIDASDAPFMTLGDRGRLRQVMDNLMSNASKFSEPDSEIIVSLTRLKDRVRLSIRDFGSGIPKKAQPAIFDKFFQVDSSDTRSKGGTGLGLAIVRQIVDQHEGSVSFFSEVGEGTEFFVDLPEFDGERAIAIPVADTNEATGFSRLPGVVSDEFVPAADETVLEGLLAAVRANGATVKTEVGHVSVEQIAKGRGVVSQSAVFNWMRPQQRAFVVNLVGEGLLENRGVALVEQTVMSQSEQGRAVDVEKTLELVQAWLDETGKANRETGMNPSLKAVVIVPDGNWTGAGIAEDQPFFTDPNQALVLLKENPHDYVVWLDQFEGAATATVLPLNEGTLPKDFPFTLVVRRRDERNGELGIVSKFSSSEGGGRTRARRRVGASGQKRTGAL